LGPMLLISKQQDYSQLIIYALIIDIGSHEFIDHAIRYMLGT